MRKGVVSAALFAVITFAPIGCSGESTSNMGDTTNVSPSPQTRSDEHTPTEATPGQPDSTAENDLAASMLLTLADFPGGWIHKPADASYDPQASAPDPLKSCFSSELVGQTGYLFGGEFSDENTTLLSINPSVYVFDSTGDAQKAAGTILSQVQCLADVIGDGLDIDSSFAFGETRTEPLDAQLFGATAAIRWVNTQIYKNQQPPRTDVLVFDVVVIVDGRVLYEVDGFQRHAPIDQTLLRTYVEKARLKVRQE